MRDGPQLSRLARGIDSAIGVVSPRWQLQRHLARDAAARLAYRGASTDRHRADWNTSSGSADAELLWDLPRLRDRSRDLVQNDATAAGIIDAFITNVVGSGIRPQSRIDTASLRRPISDEQADEFQESAERVFTRWGRYSDAQHRLTSFWEIEALALRAVLVDGDVFAMPLRIGRRSADGRRRPYSLAVQLIEAERVSTPAGINQINPTTGFEIRDGVEINKLGQPVGYWVRKTHPGDKFSTVAQMEQYDRVKAYNSATGLPNILHVYRELRPGQTRGAPLSSPVQTLFKDHSDYMEAELVAARVSACYSAFVTKSDPYSALIAKDANTKGQRLEDLEPGIVEYLAPGESISFGNPQRPGNTFAPFVEQIQRNIGASLGLPYEVVTKNYSRTNFSSARAALLDARRTFRGMQDWLAAQFCQPLYELLIDEAFSRRELPTVANFLFARNRDAWTAARWIGPGYGYVRPDQEVKASLEAIKGGLSTLSDECAALGRDWQDVQDQLARETKRAAERGLPAAADDSADNADDELVDDEVKAA